MLGKTYFLRLDNNRGIVLIATYLLIVVLFVLGTAFFARTTTERKITEVDKDNAIAFNVAEAGIARAVVYMRDRTGGSDTDDNYAFDPFDNETTITDSDVSSASVQSLYSDENNTTIIGTYQVIIDPDESNEKDYGKNRFIIIVRGTSAGISRTLAATIQIDNFARFAYFSDDEHFRPPTGSRVPVWFITGDEIWGPTHTNSHFHILGDPIFHDLVASVDNFITYYTPPPAQGNNPQFLGSGGDTLDGLTLGTDPIQLPHQAIALHNAAVQGGIVFNTDTTVVLKSDGTMDVFNDQFTDPVEYPDGCAHGGEACNMPLPTTKPALYVSGGNLTLSGTLDGRLTVGTNKDIIIADDIRYDCEDALQACIDDPENENCEGGVNTVLRDACNDMLGIIAEKEVIVSASIAHNDLRIDGSIMAMDQSFSVEDYDSGDPRGTLTVFGGIIQDQRGPVGKGKVNMETGEAEIIHGYAKNYIYDARFVLNAPAYFPRTEDYLKLAWWEELGL